MYQFSINSLHFSNITPYQHSFLHAEPFSHLVLPNFLIKKDIEVLRKNILQQNFFRKESDLFSFSQTNSFLHSNEDVIRSFISFLTSQEMHHFLSSITGLKISKKVVDVFGSRYESGDYLLCHDDLIEKRKLAFILYLSKNFTHKDGGGLLLREDVSGKPGKIIETHVPIFNSLALFKVSRKSWHEVSEVLTNKSRYAVGGWFI